jgi:hypothetical protein
MKTFFVAAAAVAAAGLFTPTPSNAQIGFGVPGFGVQIGGAPYYGGYGHGRWGYGGGPYYGGYGYAAPYQGGYGAYDYEEPVVVQRRVYSDYNEPVVRRRIYRERPVSMTRCRTVTVQRPNGTLRYVRRCG